MSGLEIVIVQERDGLVLFLACTSTNERGTAKKRKKEEEEKETFSFCSILLRY